KVQRRTQCKRITALRAWLDWCREAGHVSENVARKLTPPRTRDRAYGIVKRAVSFEELERICRAVETDHARRMASTKRSDRCPRLWLAATFRFAFYTGMRIGEIARLRWDAVDLDARAVTLTEQKNGKTQTIPLAPPAVDVLRELAEDATDGFVFK